MSVNNLPTDNLGTLNPLRYRGYYYDSDTNLYYVKSRYYDPEICRWINADSKANTGQGIIGCNMFAYCLNNPTNYIDLSGKDAIVLYDSDAVGHIGAVIQDSDGKWWHFYWGTANDWTRVACAVGLDVTPLTWCVPYTGELDLDQINADESYGGAYEKMLYLKGDFSDSVTIAKNPGGLYNLYSNNCAQVTLNTLAASDTVYRDALSTGSNAILPKNAFATVKREMAGVSIEQRKGRFYNYFEWNYVTAV